ncbi:insulin-like growth factor-binding protein 2-A, partial [Anneissia japonica]|uniref:insulin-like growth factor-binding protein 2-A n=1 Tax=Anneissia japonica TaxID=1529436 RepID=UPI0014259B54
MERLWISLCFLVIAAIAVNSVSAMFLPKSNKFRCSLCEDKDMLRCADLKCPLGSTPVMDTCGRCKICGKTEQEECGGVCNMFGFCSEGLQCYTGPLDTHKKVDVRMIAEKFTNAGKCMKPSDIPKSEPKKSKPEKPDIVYFSSNQDG